ncbi:HEPN domain-containing protein [Frigoribacterium sp. RIT-PI-h]|uniref:HEPN domain-containing protein n=1 Tax=Frigoribacterium sp. RIT-PI-h TaxID=1690245 RepID=UPI000B331F1C|nr:HEPN domain-containing protein [Frigoribacterium sp. RIT-PI-h]
MTSPALQEFLVGVEEVRALRSHGPRATGRPGHAQAALLEKARTAHRRACAVLICSHLERYIYGLNETLSDFLGSASLTAENIPNAIRLAQSKAHIDDMGQMQWDNREAKLKLFALTAANLWRDGEIIAGLDADRNIEWMKAPKPKSLVRLFRMYEIDNIFSVLSRSKSYNASLQLAIASLVDTRNGIAHGDRNVQPLSTEVTAFVNAAEAFAVRVDRVVAKHVARRFGSGLPW